MRAMAAFAIGRSARAQPPKPTIKVQKLNHLTLMVSDLPRSRDFYQGLFGMPVQSRQGPAMGLRIGPGPQFLFLAQAPPNSKPAINHFCMMVEHFDVERVLDTLAQHGVSKSAGSGPMKSRVRMRGPENGGATDGTPELYFTDPDGLSVQLQDTTYCGGAGAMGEICMKPEPAPKKGLLAVRDLSHMTLAVADPKRSIAFYRELFDMRVQVLQGDAPLLSVGAGPQFLALAGGTPAGAPNGAPALAHACLTMEGFHPDRVMKRLADYGIKPRGDAKGAPAPLTAYVGMRTADHGGAKDGTPELVFTDPDGITMQLQDVKYCGGAGKLGEVCS